MTYEERLALAIGRDQATEQDDALTLIVRHHATLVYRIAYSILRDTHDAEDVAQETFVVKVYFLIGVISVIRGIVQKRHGPEI